MSAVPYKNARLRSVGGAGFSEDYDRDAGDQPAKWAGNAAVTVIDRRYIDQSGDTLSQVKQTEMTLPIALRIAIEPDDMVTYEQDHETFTRRVRDVERVDRTRILTVTFWDD